MKYLASLFLSLAVLVVPSQAQVKKHALPKIAKAAVKVAVVAPKATAVALKDTIGAVLFGAEAVVDVVHAGTTALSKVGSMELKKNPFVAVDRVVGYGDTGLEKAALFFFNVNI